MNSLIQELRNITFILQSEKHRFSDFDAWYLPLRDRMKADPKCKWLHDTRNLVVKQGALQGASSAALATLTSQEVEVGTIPIEHGWSFRDILSSEDFKASLPKLRQSVDPHEDAVLRIERRWSTNDLSGEEILSVLAEVYKSLSEIVLGAHIHVGELGCIPLINTDASALHRDFPLVFDRNRKLRCMMYEVSQRSDFFRLSSLERMIPQRLSMPLDMERVRLMQRYGTDALRRSGSFEAWDPLAVAEEIVYTSKKVLRKDRSHARILWMRDGLGEWHQITVIAANRAEKHLLMYQLAGVTQEIGVDAVVEVGEMWTVSVDGLTLGQVPDLERHPARKESLAVFLSTREGLRQSFATPFTRGTNGGIRFGETESNASLRSNHLAPIHRVWAEQRRPPADSQVRRVVWRPDDLEPCPCGDDKPFGTCCRRHLDSGWVDSELDVDVLLQSGDLLSAEELARARLARYAIWVRQHTARSINSDRIFANFIIPTDAGALEYSISLLERVMMAVGRPEAILLTYSRLQEILGVPALARRMVALAARWLIKNGRVEEGLLHLDALGEILHSGDWLALTLAAEHSESSDEETSRLLETAVNVALDSSERSVAISNLTYHHFLAGRSKEAIASIDLLLSDPKADEAIVKDLRILRWHLAPASARIEDILGLMRAVDEEKKTLLYASWLMNLNRTEQACDLLSQLANSGHTEAILLSTECNLRNSDAAAASRMFESVRPVDLQENQRLLYAHIQAQLVLSGGRQDLRLKAVEDLKLHLGGPADHVVRALLTSIGVNGENR